MLKRRLDMEVSRISDLNEISFPKLGWTFHIDPTAFTVFGVSIQWYGIIITLGMLLAFVYCLPKMIFCSCQDPYLTCIC